MEHITVIPTPAEDQFLKQLNQRLDQANSTIQALEEERIILIEELTEARRQLFTMRGA